MVACCLPERRWGSGVSALLPSGLVQIVGEPKPERAVGGTRTCTNWTEHAPHSSERLSGIDKGCIEPVLVQSAVLVVAQITVRGCLQEAPGYLRHPTETGKIHGGPDQRDHTRRSRAIPVGQNRSTSQILRDLAVRRPVHRLGQSRIVGTDRTYVVPHGLVEGGGHVDGPARKQLTSLRIGVSTHDGTVSHCGPALRPYGRQDEDRTTLWILKQRTQSRRYPLRFLAGAFPDVPLKLVEPNRGTRRNAFLQRSGQRLGRSRVERMPQPPPCRKLLHRLPACPGFTRRRTPDQNRHPTRAAPSLRHHLP